jgi:REP element-mobilizing transposase RayT
VFADPASAQLLLDAIDYARSAGHAYILALALLPDHLHLILVPRTEHTVSDILMNIKRYAAKTINVQLGARALFGNKASTIA